MFEFTQQNRSYPRTFREREACDPLRDTTGLLRDTKSASAPRMHTLAPQRAPHLLGVKGDCLNHSHPACHVHCAIPALERRVRGRRGASHADVSEKREDAPIRPVVPSVLEISGPPIEKTRQSLLFEVTLVHAELRRELAVSPRSTVTRTSRMPRTMRQSPGSARKASPMPSAPPRTTASRR